MNITSDSVLIVIDVQEGFEDLEFFGPRNNPVGDTNISKLIKHWKNSGRPIVVVQHDDPFEESPLAPTRPGHALKPYVAEVQPALFISKTVNSAFYGTPDLNEWLKEKGYSQLVIVGIQTNMCCEITARMAGNLGYEVLFVTDATYTFDIFDENGEGMTADQLSKATEINLVGGWFATAVTTEELIAV